MRYSRIRVFCNALLKTKRSPMVITAGFENPDTASAGVRKFPKKRILNTNKAVTSNENFSVTKRIKARRINPRTNAISNVMGQIDLNLNVVDLFRLKKAFCIFHVDFFFHKDIKEIHINMSVILHKAEDTHGLA